MRWDVVGVVALSVVGYACVALGLTVLPIVWFNAGMALVLGAAFIAILLQLRE